MSKKAKIKSEQIEMVSVNSLIPHEKNMNIHKPEQIDRLCKLIDYQGFRVPLIVQKGTNVVVAGHGRLEAAKKMGIKEVPVTYQEFDSEAQLYAFMVSDNAIAKDSWASLDHELILKEKELFADLDIELLGFDDFELPEIKELDEANEDTIPENVDTRAKLGDIWLLGEHRLMCGDSTDILQVKKLMNGEEADMVFTDPPYGMNLDSDWSGTESKEWAKFRPNQGMKSGENKGTIIGDGLDFRNELITSIFQFNYCENIFIWGSDYFSELLPNRNDGSWIVWDKTHSSEGLDKMFGSNFELCWSKKKHKRELARITWKSVFGRDEGKAGHKILHPTQKPVKLAEWFFDKWGKDSTNIVDLYGGSGSTLIACEKTNRKCFMAELDPKYVDTIIARWEKYTNKTATRLESNN